MHLKKAPISCLQAFPDPSQPSLITSDCQQLILKVNSKWSDNSALSSLVELIRQSLSLFPSTSLKHIPRTANIEAHVLAREALRHDEDCM
ncbi:hypothetical protein F8388_021599 [Cannabis sativa]|uniref:RNase H type-1 domain-containing protein n=1 Tax=Cannabis sativa TaxID=3483 RepID=A0A7J6G5X7_CANSA|nr:hypothetical protein F8388_021599 [Cannabis sativa]KAF4386402.1 hypothetical protein G4B88_020222 [Cannabis sativa]